MTDLVEFLRAQLAADEAAARAATAGPWRWDGDFSDDEAELVSETEYVDADFAEESWPKPVISAHGMHTEGFVVVERDDAAHIARHNPARVLADVEYTRLAVELHGDSVGHECVADSSGAVGFYGSEADGLEPCLTLRLLAQPYAGQEGWQEAWRI